MCVYIIFVKLFSVYIPVLVVLASGFLLSQPFEVFRVAIRNFHRIDIEQTCVAVFRVGTVVAAIIVLSFGGGLLGLAITTSAFQLAQGLFFVIVTKQSILGLRLNPYLFDPQLARSFFSPSIYFFLISLSGAIIWGTDNLVISINIGAGSVVPFAVTMQLLQVGIGLVGSTINAVIPTITAFYVRNDEQQLRRALKQVVKIGFALLTLLGVSFTCYGRDLIRLWVGQEHTAPLSVFIVLLAVFLIRSFGMLFEMMVVGTLKHSGYAYMVLIEGVLNLVLSVTLVRSFGILGVAAGTLIAHAACTGWFLPFRALRIAKCTLREVVANSILPVIPAAVTAFIISLFLVRLPINDGLVKFLIGSLTTTVVYGIVFWVTGLNAEEKLLARSILRKTTQGQ